MSAAIPFHKHTVGRTFMIAITVLGFGALLQFGAMSWLFLTRFRTGAPGEAPLAAVPPLPGAAKEFTDPFGDAPGAPTTTAASAPPKPTPVPARGRPATDPAVADRMGELIEQGRILRDRGDTYAAVTKQREAGAIAEDNPQPIAELAMTYEKMGFNEKASECWRRIYDMGEAAGVYFAAADAKLQASKLEALRTVDAGSPPAANTPPAASEPVAASGTVPVRDGVGLGGTHKLGLADITQQEEAEPGAKRKFVLNVPVKAKARARIDVHDVVVQVLFYDVINGKSLDRTNATVSYKWSNPPADWADDDVEVLQVNYLLPELRVTDEDRKFFGYTVSLYYKNALQDFRSEPPALAQKAPPAAALAQEPP